jgi:thiol-disulfide isomerase/thioredoxin
MRSILVVFSIVFCLACRSPEKNGGETEPGGTYSTTDDGFDTLGLRVYDFEGLKPRLEQNDDRVHIVNFWATWCEPCIRELPYFEQITADYEAEEVQVLLVNLDMPSMWGPRLLPYIQKQDIKSEVVILDDPRQNSWIPRVSPQWSGAIPATVIYTKDKREFYERQFSAEELKAELHKFLKNEND